MAISNEDERKTKAKIETLKYYFKEKDWIDLDFTYMERRMTTVHNKKISSYPPYYCDSCNQYWSYALHRKTRAKCIEYINWKNLPCQKKECENC